MRAAGNRHDKKRVAGRFVRLSQAMIESLAWRSLNGNARAIYVELANLYRGNNNGRIGFSARQAARVIPISMATAARAMVQLQDRGFIIAETKGHFDRKRQATRWRLTEHNCDVTGQAASRDFDAWATADILPLRPHGERSEREIDG